MYKSRHLLAQTHQKHQLHKLSYSFKSLINNNFQNLAEAYRFFELKLYAHPWTKNTVSWSLDWKKNFAYKPMIASSCLPGVTTITSTDCLSKYSEEIQLIYGKHKYKWPSTLRSYLLLKFTQKHISTHT